MQRRMFLKCVGGAAACASTPFLGLSSVSASQASLQSAFNTALANNPSLIGMASMTGNLPRQPLEVEGQLPSNLNGMLLRNGPAKFDRANQRYNHWFEGDGMLQQFVFDNGQIHHQGKFIDTPKFVSEERAQRFIYPGPNSPLADTQQVSNPNTVNVANTNIIPVGDEWWALWEAGAATAVNGNTLGYKRQVNLGTGTDFNSQLKGMPFSAHPKIDSNGDIWNFGLSAHGDLIIYHLSAAGKLKNLSLLAHKYHGGMLHDFLITEKHLLMILPSLKKDWAIKGQFSRVTYQPQQPMQVLVIDKNTLAIRKTYELEPGFAFHFGNGWEDRAGNIHFDASLHDSVDALHEMFDLMQGRTDFTPRYAETTFFTLHACGDVTHSAYDRSSEFPRVCQHRTGHKNRYLFHVSGNKRSIWHHSIVAIDTETGSDAVFDYGEEFIVEEHIPVCPDPNKEAGYLLGTALHVPSKRTCINVFTMSEVSSGPIARAWLPYHLPLGFHGNFVLQ